jgi:hypothetical protein
MRRIACLCVFALSCTGERGRHSQTPPAPPPEIEVSRHPASLGTEFVIENNGCRIEWTVLAHEPGVVRHRSECALTPAGQAPLLGKILNSVLGAHMTLRALDWGRLFPDGAEDATMPVFLALAAKKSPDWDVIRGKPRSPDINGTIRRLVNESGMYQELSAVFRKAGLEIEVAYVEKVLVAPAVQLPFFDRLRSQGIEPKDQVPFDCIVWLSIRSMERRVLPPGGGI